MHLYWEVPPQALSEVRADLTVTEPPAVDRLYFWALQVNFVSGGRTVGAPTSGFSITPPTREQGPSTGAATTPTAEANSTVRTPSSRRHSATSTPATTRGGPAQPIASGCSSPARATGGER